MTTLAKKGDFVLVLLPRSSTSMHGGRKTTQFWEPGIVTKVVQGNVEKALIGLGSASTEVHRYPRNVLSVKEIPGGSAAALVQMIRSVTGDQYPEFASLKEARDVILDAMERLGKRNPGFSKTEEKQYKAIVRSGKARYGKRVKQVAARTVLKRRRITARGRRKARKNPSPKHGRVERIEVKHFQGYATDVAYQRELDGLLYHHPFDTDAAELYLCVSKEFGHCVLVVDPSGRTPLWK